MMSKLREMYPATSIIATALRAMAGAGLALAVPVATAVSPMLGKVAYSASILFFMLAVWSIALPLESAVTTWAAERIKALFKPRELTAEQQDELNAYCGDTMMEWEERQRRVLSEPRGKT